MKKCIMLVFFLGSIIGFSQDYEAKVKDLNNQIDSAAAIDNEVLVTQLETERDLYLKLQEAIQNNDQVQTIVLKRKLRIRPSTTFDDYGAVEYTNNKRGVEVKVMLPSEFTETNHDSKFLQQDMVLSGINEQSFQLVIQKSDRMDMVAMIEQIYSNKAMNITKYEVGEFEVVEFDIDNKDEKAKFKLIYYAEGYIYLTVSSAFPFVDEDVNAYFNSLILNEKTIVKQ